MSRGPTRRVQRLVEDGAVLPDVLARADHEADLLAHPYIDVVHIQLARLALEGNAAERNELLSRLIKGLPAHRWRPRGPWSAARPRGRRQALEAQRHAMEQDRLAGNGRGQTAPEAAD